MRARRFVRGYGVLGILIALAMALAGAGCHRKPAAPAGDPAQAQYEQGVAALRAGKPQEAGGFFDTAIRLKPSFAPAYFALAQMDVRSGQPAQAISRLEALRRAAPGTPHVACRLAELHAATGRFVEALTAAQDAVKAEPQCPRAWMQYGLEMAAAGKKADALKALQTAHTLDPASERVSLILAQMLAPAGKADEAWKLVEPLSSTPDASSQALYLRGWLLAEYPPDGKRDDKQALTLLDRSLAAAPNNALANLEKGRILLRAGDAKGALVYLERARSAAQPSVELLTALADAQARLKSPRAERLRRDAANFSKFADDLYSARQRYIADPNSRDNLVRLARMEASVGNVQDAQALLTRVLQKHPNDTEALALLTPRADAAHAPSATGASAPTGGALAR